MNPATTSNFSGLLFYTEALAWSLDTFAFAPLRFERARTILATKLFDISLFKF